MAQQMKYVQSLMEVVSAQMDTMESNVNLVSLIYRKVASTNASRFVTRLVYMHTQNDIFLRNTPIFFILA